jgi:hypothetical protein
MRPFWSLRQKISEKKKATILLKVWRSASWQACSMRNGRSDPKTTVEDGCHDLDLTAAAAAERSCHCEIHVMLYIMENLQCGLFSADEGNVASAKVADAHTDTQKEAGESVAATEGDPTNVNVIRRLDFGGASLTYSVIFLCDCLGYHFRYIRRSCIWTS